MTLIGGAVVYWNDIENFCFRLYKLAITNGERMKEKLIEEYLLKILLKGIFTPCSSRYFIDRISNIGTKNIVNSKVVKIGILRRIVGGR